MTDADVSLKDNFPRPLRMMYNNRSGTGIDFWRGCGLSIEPVGKRLRFAQVFHRGPLQFKFPFVIFPRFAPCWRSSVGRASDL